MSFPYETIMLPDDSPLMLVHRNWKVKPKKTSTAKQTDGSSCLTSRNPHSSTHSQKKRTSTLLAKSSNLGDASKEAGQIRRRDTLTHFPAPYGRRGTDLVATNYYVNYYLHATGDALYPLSNYSTFNPIRDKCFQVAVADELWFLTIMYCSARQLAITSQNPQYSRDVTLLFDMVVKKLATSIAKAKNGEQQPVTVVCAISCLTSVEHNLGNAVTSTAHVKALAELINARGGLDTIDGDLRWKVHRADVDSAVDMLIPPLIAPSPLSKSSILKCGVYSPTETNSYPDHVQFRPSFSQLDLELAVIADDISNLSNTVEHALLHQIPMDPNSLDEHTIHILHRLLVYDTNFSTPIDKAFRIAALLYVKALTRPISALATTSSIQTRSLQEFVGEMVDVSSPLALWISFMGLMASEFASGMREWFREKLSGHNWQDIRSILSRILWIPQILDTYAKEVWLESYQIS